MEKITPFDVFAQKNIGYSDVLELFRFFSKSLIFACWTIEFGKLRFVFEL